MSVRVQSKVWEHSAASGHALVVLLKIADNCDDAGTNAWPSLPSLARYCRCSVSTVKRSIRELVALGELEVVHKGGSKRPGFPYAPNLYRVKLERYQVDPSGRLNLTSPEGPRLDARRVISHHPDGSAVDPNSSIDPSRTATGSNRTIADAHLRLARQALGILGNTYRDGVVSDGSGCERP